MRGVITLAHMETVDVGIVGAGIHGVSAAYHLAAGGVTARLFERGAPAGGPTGRSSAVCRGYYTNEFLAVVAHESIDMFRAFREMTGGDAGYRETGLLFLHPPGDEDQLRRSVASLREIGTSIRLYDRAALAAEFPGFAQEGIAFGAWEERAGYADPVSATSALFQAALRRGLRASLHTEAERVEPRAGGGAIVTTSEGERVECARLLLAAGPWTKPLAAQVGSELPLTVERHVVATLAWGAAPRMGFGHADLVGGYYMRPDGDELFILGPLHPEPQADPDAFDERIAEPELRELGAAVTRRVPALDVAQSRGGWASLYDISPDWQPVIGEVADGVFVDAGTSGHGFKLGPALGRYVASMVTGSPDPGLEQFHPRRFTEGRALRAGYGAARIIG